MILAFDIPIPMQPWERATPIGYGKALETKTMRSYTASIGLLAAVAKPASWPLDARYVVIVHVPDVSLNRGDVDNIEKAIFDALNGVAWKDDAQVTCALVFQGAPKRRVEIFVADGHHMPHVWAFIEGLHRMSGEPLREKGAA